MPTAGILLLSMLLLAASNDYSSWHRVEVLKTTDRASRAFFQSFDASTGCIETDVFLVTGFVKQSSPPDPSTSTPLTTVVISVGDNCQGVSLMSAQGATDAFDYTSSNDLQSSHLSGNVPMVDFQSGRTFSVALNIDWAGDGPLVRDVSHFHQKTDGFIVNAISVSTFRTAVATGTILEGTTNYSPTPSQAAQIEVELDGQVTIQVGRLNDTT